MQGRNLLALDQIELLLATPNYFLSVASLQISPVFDPLREHPRYQALIEKYVICGETGT